MAAEARDTHHLCWPRKRWNKGWAKVLRYHWYMRVEIPMKTLHREIHNHLDGVPLPSDKAIKRAVRHLDKLAEAGVITEDDGIEKRLAIIIPLFPSREADATAFAFRRQFDIATKFYHPKHRPHR